MRKYLKFIGLCLVAALILLWFGWQLNWAEVSEAIRRADGRLIGAALCLVCATYLIRAFRWRALLAPLAPGASLRELFAATTVGFGAVFLIGRAGEVMRPAFLPLRERRVGVSAAFVTIAVERIYDMAAIVVLFAANLLVFSAPGGSDGAASFARVRQAGFVMLLGAMCGIAGLILFRRHSERVLGRLEDVSARLPGLLGRAGRLLTRVLSQLAHSLGVLVNARELLVTVGWTALLWGAIAFANLLVFRAFGLDFGLSATIFVLGWSLVGSLVPTPGGAAGTYHAATAAGLIFLGVARAEAAAVAIILHLVVFGPASLLGLYYFLRSDVSLARLRNLAAVEGKDDEFARSRDRVSAEEKLSAGGDAARA